MNHPQLSLIVIRTKEPEALLPFYNALGLDFVREQHGSRPIHFSCTPGDVVMEIYPLKVGASEQDLTAPMLGFRVESLDEALEKVRAIGSRVSGEPKTAERGRWCNVFDSDGRTVQISER